MVACPAAVGVAAVMMKRPVAAVLPARAAGIALQEPLRPIESPPTRGSVEAAGAEAAAAGEQSSPGTAVAGCSGMTFPC